MGIYIYGPKEGVFSFLTHEENFRSLTYLAEEDDKNDEAGDVLIPFFFFIQCFLPLPIHYTSACNLRYPTVDILCVRARISLEIVGPALNAGRMKTNGCWNEKTAAGKDSSNPQSLVRHQAVSALWTLFTRGSSAFRNEASWASWASWLRGRMAERSTKKIK